MKNENIINEIKDDIRMENCNGSIDGMRVYIKTVRRLLDIFARNNEIDEAGRGLIISALEAKAQRTALSVHPELFR